MKKATCNRPATIKIAQTMIYATIPFGVTLIVADPVGVFGMNVYREGESGFFETLRIAITTTSLFYAPLLVFSHLLGMRFNCARIALLLYGGIYFIFCSIPGIPTMLISMDPLLFLFYSVNFTYTFVWLYFLLHRDSADWCLKSNISYRKLSC